MKNRYIVMTSGRGYTCNMSSEFGSFQANTKPDPESLTMDVRSSRSRHPMSLIEAKQRAAHIAQTEKGVIA